MCKRQWFTKEVKKLCKEKGEAYLKYRSQKTSEEYEKYKNIRNKVNLRKRSIKEEHWEKFSKDIEHNFYGSQRMVWKLIRSLEKLVKKYKEKHPLDIKKCTNYFTQLYNEDKNNDNSFTKTETLGSEWIITKGQAKRTIQTLKNRKAPREDTITNNIWWTTFSKSNKNAT
ncbi:hypothetical protein M0802_012622 [Mischocyttarus mexicanus]|nr:hypothetical protein M0802_012622 [Mischocyttarus mexicanus]